MDSRSYESEWEYKAEFGGYPYSDRVARMGTASWTTMKIHPVSAPKLRKGFLRFI